MRRNLDDLMLLENPYYGNPRRRRRKRNPSLNPIKMPTAIKQWTQGIDLMEAGAAFGGLSAALLLPDRLVVTAATGMRKFLRVIVSLGGAIAAGYIGKNISPSVSKAAIMGGMAGAVSIALKESGVWTMTGRRSLTTGRMRETSSVPSSLEPIQMIVP